MMIMDRNLTVEQELKRNAKSPYFQKVPLIGKRMQLSFPLIPLFSANPEGLDAVNKGIRENENEAALLLRELSKNKGWANRKMNEYFTFLK